jgi:hypothetical protein
MCDYSLELYRSRPAVQGEEYQLHRFRSGTLGFVDPVDCATAVCMPTGARLRLQGLDKSVQLAFGVGADEQVTMVCLPFRGNTHRDGVRFANGREVLLQNINVGVSAMLAPRDLVKILDLEAEVERDRVDA